MFSKTVGVELLFAKGADINVRDSGGKTPLMYATENEYLGRQIPVNPLVIKELLAKGAEIDAKDSNGQTALMHAVQNDFRNHPLEAVKTLLANGADVNAMDNKGSTALMLVSVCNSEVKSELENELIAKGAKRKPDKTLKYSKECKFLYGVGPKF
jgi:ankyrin repeat protein